MTSPATDVPFVEASRLGDVSDLDLELDLPVGDPEPIGAGVVQSEEGKTAVPPEPRPWFRRYTLFAGGAGVAGAPVEIETEKPYWRLLTVAAPTLPAGLEFSFDRLFRDPDVATIATNLIRIPIGPAQALFARVAAGEVVDLVLSVLVDPWIHRR